jgi:hypothetical protein
MAPPHTAIRTGVQARETTETTGTGTLTLAGAVSGFQTLLAATAASAVVRYNVRLRNGTEWEWGVGTLNAGGTTLARTTVLRSSNANAAVNFSGGTKDVWIGIGPDAQCHVSASAPAVTDDNDTQQGFLPGSLWLNTTTDVLYVLVDDTNGAAIWVPLNKHAGNNAACSELTIASGAVTLTDTIHRIDTESNAASDELDTLTLSTARDGSVIFLKAENTARTVWLTNAGNVVTPNAKRIELSTKQYAQLVYNSTDSKWIVVGWPQGTQGFFSNTDGATVTFDIAKSRKHTVTMGGNRTLAVTNDWDGAVFMIETESDGTGRTPTFFSGITWASGSAPTPTAAANKSDLFIFTRRSSGVYLGAVLAQNYTN